ncbi:MAG: oligosaccharide flippase family protein, partial [Nitrososphaerota archaeon]
ARGIFTICIFIFIKKVADYFYVPLLYSLGYVVAGGLSLGIVFKDFGVKFTLPTLTAIRHQLKEGWHFFVTIISVNLRTTSNAFILGLLTNNTIVGYYSGAEKLIRAAIGVFDPITVTVYPHISQLMDKSKEAGLKFVKKLIFLIGGIGFSLSAISFFFAPFIVKIILGPQYQPSILVLQILSIIPFIAGIAGVLGSQTMVTLNYKKQFARIHFSAAALNLLLIFFLVLLYKQAGAAMAWVITDIFVVILMTIFLWRKRINILN